METLLDEVSSGAYDKAVEKVAKEAMLATRRDDIRLAEDSKKWIQDPKHKASKREKDYAIKRLDGLIRKNRNSNGESGHTDHQPVKTAREEKNCCRRNQKGSEAIYQGKTCTECSKNPERRGREKKIE